MRSACLCVRGAGGGDDEEQVGGEGAEVGGQQGSLSQRGLLCWGSSSGAEGSASVPYGAVSSCAVKWGGCVFTPLLPWVAGAGPCCCLPERQPAVPHSPLLPSIRLHFSYTHVRLYRAVGASPFPGTRRLLCPDVLGLVEASAVSAQRQLRGSRSGRVFCSVSEAAGREQARALHRSPSPLQNTRCLALLVAGVLGLCCRGAAPVP